MLIEKIDLGCGTKKKEGYYGIDVVEYPGVDKVMDLRMSTLPFPDGSLTDVYCSHFLEHLTFEENCHLFNEAYRVLKEGGIFEIVVPHGMSYSGMADLSHKTFWTEDTFGYFTEANTANYSWGVTQKWKIISNDNTPPYFYSKEGWVTAKNREIHAFLQKYI